MYHFTQWVTFQIDTFLLESILLSQASFTQAHSGWHRDQTISTGVMPGFSQAPEETAPVSALLCVPTERPIPGVFPHLLPAAACQLQSVRSEDKQRPKDEHPIIKRPKYTSFRFNFSYGNWQRFFKLVNTSVLTSHALRAM